MVNYQRFEAQLDVISNQLIANGDVPFLHILIEKDSIVVYDKVLGYKDPEKQNLLTKDALYRVASQTKAITSVAAMMLWEQGKFLLEDPLHKYLPTFKGATVLENYNHVDGTFSTVPAKREVCIKDIMSHTSGIGYAVLSDNPGMAAIYGNAKIATGIGSIGNLKQQVESLGPLPLTHQPGTKFTYGLNTDILGHLIEIWSGVSLSEYVHDKIFKPLEMHDTSFKVPPGKRDRLVDLFKKDADHFVKVTDPIIEGNPVDYPFRDDVYLSGGAGLVSTVYDYAKFLKIFTEHGLVNNQRYLSSKSLAMLSNNQLSTIAIANGDLDFRFGLGTALIDSANNFSTPVSAGTLYWAGAFNTQYWVDPVERIVGLVYTQQYLPDSYWDLGSIYKNVVYSNLEYLT